MVYPVSWTAVCYVTVITLFIKIVGVVRPNFGGSGPPPTPSGCALVYFDTSATAWRGMFFNSFICLFVSRITEKVIYTFIHHERNNFHEILDRYTTDHTTFDLSFRKLGLSWGLRFAHLLLDVWRGGSRHVLYWVPFSSCMN